MERSGESRTILDKTGADPPHDGRLEGFDMRIVKALKALVVCALASWGVAAAVAEITWADSPPFAVDTSEHRNAMSFGWADSGLFFVDNRMGAWAWSDSEPFAVDNRTGTAGTQGLTGSVVEIDAGGKVKGPLGGATIAVPGVGSTMTNSQGQFTLANLPAGVVNVTVSKAGYYTVERPVSLAVGEWKHETFQLLAEATGGIPGAFNFRSPKGWHLLEGMPGNLQFEVTVAWRGSPGAVYYTVASVQHAATITDLGGGLARATLTVPAPAVIHNCSELTIEVVNGENRRTLVTPGVRFYPMAGIVGKWCQENIPWVTSGPVLTWSEEYSINWELPLRLTDVELAVFLGCQRGARYDPLGGVLGASAAGFGGFGIDVELSEFEVLDEGRFDLNGTLDVSWAGCASAPTVTPGWVASFTGKSGVGGPAVLAVDIFFPPAAPAVHYLLTVPVVKDVVGALKVRVYFIGGASLAGQYPSGQWGNCFLGARQLTVSGTIGAEAHAVLEAFGAEAGVYAGGTGTPEFTICPEWVFEGITVRGYIGVFAKAWLFEYSREFGVEMRFGGEGEGQVLAVVPLGDPLLEGRWRPIGAERLRWGEANRLVAGRPVRLAGSNSLDISGEAIEDTLIENLTALGSPSVIADATQTHILYSRHDPNKPWYAATDIASLRWAQGGPWSQALIADDNVADYVPRIATVDANTDLAAWQQIDGDVSWATNPGEVIPYMEIAASWFSRTTAQWTAPVLLVNNDAVDRDPLPVVFGARTGIVWIQNEGEASPGHATSGDRLMYAEWDGAGWTTPAVLWSGPKGIIDMAFAADAAGEGHVVFVVDEDGDPETREDRELYGIATVGGVWQNAVRLTTDAVEDALPVLVTPNGEVICVWSSDAAVVYTPLANWQPAPVYAEHTLANEAPTLDGVTMPGGAAVAYTVQGPEGVDIVAAFYDAALDGWSLPRRLTQDEHAETSVSLACDGTQLVIAYLKTQTERKDVQVEIGGVPYVIPNVPQPARTDLCLLRHTLGHDLAVGTDSLVVEPANPEPGSPATIRARVENRGELGAEDVQVAFYDGDPSLGGQLIGTVQTVPGLLLAGSAREVSVEWNVPEPPKSYEVFVVVDPALVFDDRNRANNTSSRWAVLPDLTIETGWSQQVTQTSVVLVARTVNAGVVPTEPFELCWRLDALNGPEIGRSPVEAMLAGAAQDVSFNWDTTGMTPGEWVQVYAVADCTGAVFEFDESNNTHAQAVIIPVPICRGDLNCDGVISFGDINPFVLALSNWSAWVAQYPNCPPENADVNGDGQYGGANGFGDINPFVELLATAGGYPIPCP